MQSVQKCCSNFFLQSDHLPCLFSPCHAQAFLFFLCVCFSSFFQRIIQGIASSLSLNKAKVGASPLSSLKFMHATQVFYLLLPTFLSFIFFFNSFPSSSFFLVSIFSICSSLFSFPSFFLKFFFIHLHICTWPIFFLNVFATFLQH